MSRVFYREQATYIRLSRIVSGFTAYINSLGEDAEMIDERSAYVISGKLTKEIFRWSASIAELLLRGNPFYLPDDSEVGYLTIVDSNWEEHVDRWSEFLTNEQIGV